jgi:SP family general alpha glucoside:H+ symporter-like MFS transporter
MASTAPTETRNDTAEGVKARHAEYPGKSLDLDAKLATEAEHNLGLWQGIKTYRKAVFWSVAVSASIIMEGYDVTLINSFYAYPAFQKKYGTYHGGTVGWQLSGPWQAGISDIQAVGNLIGALANGYFTHKYGHRKVMMVNLALMTGFIFITFFAPSAPVLLVGALLCSIPWGVFATQGPAYASETVPLVLRGYLTAFVNLCWATGQLLSAAVLKGLVNNKTEWSYRIPFAVQWVWVRISIITFQL